MGSLDQEAEAWVVVSLIVAELRTGKWAIWGAYVRDAMRGRRANRIPTLRLQRRDVDEIS